MADMINDNQDYLIDPAEYFDSESIVNKFRDFRDRSKKKFADNYDKMRTDRDFLNGETQWTKADGRHVSDKRNRMILNIVSNSVNAVVNQYSAYPFMWYTGNQEDDQLLDGLLKRGSNDMCGPEALKNSAGLGLGVMAMGTDKEGVPCIYAINDFDRVILDPDSTEIDGADMVEAALIDYRGKRWVELNYGPEWVPGEREQNIVPSRKDMVPIVTYFVLEENGCHVYTLVNNNAIDGGVLPLDRVPVVPVYGERWFDNEGDLHWNGLVSKARSIQKIVNLSVTQLAERLSLSPKPQWMGTVEAFKGLDKYYKEAGAGLNPILPYNRKSADQKDVLEPPQRFDAKVQFEDLSGVMGNMLNMAGAVTGVDARGLLDQGTQKTAQEVSYVAETYANNIRHYMVHLQSSFKALGDMVAKMVGIENQIHIAQGPIEWIGLKQARAEIVQLIQVAEPNQKPALIDALIQTYPDNPTMGKLYAQLHSIPTPTPMEMEMQQTAELMKQKIEQDQQVIMQLDQKLKEYEQMLRDQKEQRELEITKMQLQHQYDQENEILKAQLDTGVDADRAAIDAEREANRLEADAMSLAMKLDGERQKLAVQDAKNRMELDKKSALDRIAVASAAAKARQADQKNQENE
jgi:hypothetical protein